MVQDQVRLQLQTPSASTAALQEKHLRRGSGPVAEELQPLRIQTVKPAQGKQLRHFLWARARPLPHILSPKSSPPPAGRFFERRWGWPSLGPGQNKGDWRPPDQRTPGEAAGIRRQYPPGRSEAAPPGRCGGCFPGRRRGRRGRSPDRSRRDRVDGPEAAAPGYRSRNPGPLHGRRDVGGRKLQDTWNRC